MKKYLLGAALPLLAMAIAPAYANHIAPFLGPYVGAEMGGAFVVANPGLYTRTQYLNNVDQKGDFVTVVNLQNIIKENVFRGDLYTGYGLILQSVYYLGAEIFAGVGHFRESSSYKSDGSTTFDTMTYNTVNTTTAQIKPLHFGIDIRPGYLLAPDTLLYARVGIEFVSIQLDSWTNFSGGDPFVPESFSQNVPKIHRSQYSGALRLGLGLEQHITSELSLRADYVYTNYGHLGGKSRANTLTLPSGDIVNARQATSARIYSNAMVVGLTYFFC